MEKIKRDKTKEKLINHLITKDYNLHQGSDDPNVFTVYTPYDKNFIVSFYSDFVLLSVLYDFSKFDISRKKMLKLINELNTQSIRMKFAVDKDSVIIIQTRVQKCYNRKTFQCLLDDVEFDISISFTDIVKKYI